MISIRNHRSYQLLRLYNPAAQQ